MCSHWSEAKLFKFLRLYKRYECLWNPYSPEYGNSDAKSNAFSKILCEMNVFRLSVNECLNQIKYLRETYKQEQQRLENITFLGGRGYSNLLWYPLMNSMLAKVIRDEENLNHATGNLDLVLASQRSPFKSGDQGSNFNRIGYGQANFSWNQNESAAICPRLPNSNFGDYMNCFHNSNIPNYSIGMRAPNEHINSCPTCGYSSRNSCCECLPMNNFQYHRENDSFESEINYRPKTSYNYKNGILEINSAVRIPVSQQSPNCGYSNLIETIMPEESEDISYPCLSDAHPEVETVEEEEELSKRFFIKSSNLADGRNKLSDEYQSEQEIPDKDTDPNFDPLARVGSKKLSNIEHERGNIPQKSDANRSQSQDFQDNLRSNWTTDDSEKVSAARSTQDVMRRSDNILKQNLTKIVIDFIDETLNKPDEESPMDVEEKLILKEVAKDLRVRRDESNRNCKDKSLVVRDEKQSRRNINKTICWREPIEESLTIVPCKSIKSPRNKTDCGGKVHCLRMMAGADFDIDEDVQRSNVFDWKDIRSKCKTTAVAKQAFNKNKKTVHENATPTNSKEHLSLDYGDIYTARSIHNKSSQIDSEKCILAEGRFSRLVHEKISSHPNSMITGNKTPDEYCPVIIDKFPQAGESIDSDPQTTEMNDKSCREQVNDSESCDPHSVPLNVTEIESSARICISVGTSESTENEILDEVVRKITQILRKTLDDNGYAIGRKQFFTKKNLITNDNGEINRKLIGNEGVWKTELKNIIGDLMRDKKVGDSIAFKVKTMILPVTDQSNVTPTGDTDPISSLKIKEKLGDSTGGINHLDSDVLPYTPSRNSQSKKQLFKNRMGKLGRRSMKNVMHLEKILFDHVRRMVLPCNDHQHALCKLLKYLVKFSDKFQSVPEKYKKSLDKIQPKENHQETNLTETISRDKLFCCNIDKDIDVYLCTEISHEDHSSMDKTASCNHYSNSDILHDVNQHSLCASTATTLHYEQKSTRDSKDDASEWESFSDSEEEAVIAKQCRYGNEFSHQTSKRRHRKNNLFVGSYGVGRKLIRNNGYLSKDSLQVGPSCAGGPPAVDVLVKTTDNILWCQNHIEDVELLDTIIHPTEKEYLILSGGNALKDTPGLQHNSESIGILTKFGEAKVSEKPPTPNLSESEKSLSLLKTKLRITADDHIESCCTGEKTRSVCTPICDVSSQLRLCAIMKSPLRASSLDSDIRSENICCCNEMNELETAVATHSEPSIKPNQQSVVIGDGSVSSATASCQTDDLETDPKIHDARSHASNQEHTENSSNCCQVTCNKIYTKNSLIQRDAQNWVSTSFDMPTPEEGESLILEVKMIQPMQFSIDLKKRDRDLRRDGVKGDGRNGFYAQGSEFQSTSGNVVISSQQRSINHIDKATSTNFNSCGVHNLTDQRTEFLIPKNEEEASPRGIEMSQNCKAMSHSKESMKICENDIKPSSFMAFNKIDKNSSMNLGGKLNYSAPNQCNNDVIFSDSLKLLKNYQLPCQFGNEKLSVNSFSVNRKRTVPHPEEDSSDGIESIKIRNLINAVETSLEHIADPVIRRKLIDTIESLKCEDQDQSYSSQEIYSDGQPCGTLEKTSEKFEIDMRDGSENVVIPRASLLMTADSECYGNCNTEIALAANGSKNIIETMVPSIEDRDYNSSRNLKVESDDESSKIERDSQLMSTSNYSSNEISCGVEDLERNSSICDPDIACEDDGRFDMTPQLQNNKSANYDCCDRQTTGVDMKAFTNMVASQLRGLSPAAALRSQQRIQTLISNSRLESEKNKKYR